MPPSNFPPSALVADRTEHVDLPLNVVEGAIPADIGGHVFIVAPVGDVDSGGLPRSKAIPYLNGDGMVYRLDLSPGGVKLSSGLCKVPSYWADEGSKSGTPFERMGFENMGISRMSMLFLGARNFANTALIPFQPAGQNPRLLATYDAGRPYEVDPQTLKVVAPVGQNVEWRATMLSTLPFKMLQSCAHPAWDGKTGELFMVNFGRTLASIFETVPILGWLASHTALRLVEDASDEALQRYWQFMQSGPGRALLKTARAFANLVGFGGRFTAALPTTFLYVVKWDGNGPLERWNVVLDDGEPVKIRETMHQIAVTEEHLVLMDTAFKFDMDLVLNDPLPDLPMVERWMRRFLSGPQQHETVIYLIRRADLVGGEQPLAGEDEVTVVAKKITFPFETVHYLWDYEEKDGLIWLHLAHQCAMDGAEFIRDYDELESTGQQAPKGIWGMFPGAMDVSRMGRYAIDPDTGTVVDSEIVADTDTSWGIGLGTAANFPPVGAPTDRFEYVYWYTQGAIADLITDLIWEIYAPYPLRSTPLNAIREMNLVGGPTATLFRLNTTTMAFEDVWTAPAGMLISSPQFVPRAGGTGAQDDGYVVANVFTDAFKQIWIFKADDLAAGPVCKLENTALQWAYTLHTCFIDAIGPRDATYAVDPEADYAPYVKPGTAVYDLFQQAVYPNVYK